VTGTLRPMATPSQFAAPVAGCELIEANQDAGVLRVTGVLRIRQDGPYLPDHFPDITIFPGVFILEVVVQSVARALGPREHQVLRLRQVRSLRFVLPLYPGDELRMAATVTDGEAPDSVVITADCRRGDDLRVSTMTVECTWSS